MNPQHKCESDAHRNEPLRGTVGGHGIAVFACVLCMLVFEGSWAAPIATNTALPLSADELIVRQQLVMTRSSDRNSDISRSVDRFESRTVMGYGFSSKFAIFGVLPLVDISTEIGAASSSEFGLGDAALFARYEVYRSDKPGRTIRIAPFAGVRLPTGRDGKTGDGSTDVFGGLIATIASTQWVLDSQLRYDHNREANGFERGVSTSIESSFQYRLSPGKITQETSAFVFGVLELSANYYERNRLGGVTDPNSGGFQVFLTPGLQYSARRWIADLGVKVPVLNDLNGTALETDYSLLASIRVNF